MNTNRTSEEDAFLEGYHDIPSQQKLSAMSFVQLASELADCKPGSAKFLVIENAMLRHAESANKKNMISGAIIGGSFSLAGVIIGVMLSALLSKYQPAQNIICEACDTAQDQNEMSVQKRASELNAKPEAQVSNVPSGKTKNEKTSPPR